MYFEMSEISSVFFNLGLVSLENFVCSFGSNIFDGTSRRKIFDFIDYGTNQRKLGAVRFAISAKYFYHLTLTLLSYVKHFFKKHVISITKTRSIYE